MIEQNVFIKMDEPCVVLFNGKDATTFTLDNKPVVTGFGPIQRDVYVAWLRSLATEIENSHEIRHN